MSSIQIFRDFYSYPEEALRTLRVYVPDAVRENPELRCGVLYMLDGQNVFAHAESALFHTWCANWAMDEAIASDALAPWIIVGVDHLPGRFDEYTPFPFSGVHFALEAISFSNASPITSSPSLTRTSQQTQRLGIRH
ncbi:MAG: hypothetical protein RBU37_19970 [Myxococcota bacterium]|jgi:predicted alpha/beta superfamily hydrolase|nr:hypothetical protein [Myxococcota bacterium]